MSRAIISGLADDVDMHHLLSSFFGPHTVFYTGNPTDSMTHRTTVASIEEMRKILAAPR